MIARLTVVLVLASCASRPATTEEKKIEAEGTYGAQLQWCVASSETRAKADECAERVRRAWAKDGGTQ